MKASKNTDGTGGQNADGTAGNTPDVKVYEQKNASGSWEVIAYVNGHFYSSCTCWRRKDARAQVIQDLSEKGLAA